MIEYEKSYEAANPVGKPVLENLKCEELIRRNSVCKVPKVQTLRIMY